MITLKISNKCITTLINFFPFITWNWKIISLDKSGTTLGWTGRRWHFFQNWNHKRWQNMVLISFVNLQKIHIFWKFDGCSSKIEPAMPISILRYQRAWHTFKICHTLQIFKNDAFFKDEQMLLLSFFYNTNQKSTI